MSASRLITNVSIRKHIEILQLLEVGSSHEYFLLGHRLYFVARCLGGVSVTGVVVHFILLQDAILTVLHIWAQVSHKILVVLLNWGRGLGNNFINSTICVYFGHLARKSRLEI
jgi:hypothetical protein